MTLSDPPPVSVVMTVYNGARYVSATLDSILQQTFRDFELIVINDGSADATSQILQQYATLDPRIRLLHNAQNQGIGAARNRALASVRGRYVAITDADDLSLPDRLQKQITFLDEQPAVGIVGTRVRLIDATGQGLRRLNVTPTDPGVVRWMLFFRCCVVHGSAMVRRTVYQTLQGYDAMPGPGRDYDLLLRAGAITQIANLPDSLVAVRSHAESISHRQHPQQEHYALGAQQRAISAFLGHPMPLEVVRAISHIEKVTTLPQAYQAATMLSELYRAYRQAVPLSATEQQQIRSHFYKQRGYLLLKACHVPRIAAAILGGNFDALNRLANFMRY